MRSCPECGAFGGAHHGDCGTARSSAEAIIHTSRHVHYTGMIAHAASCLLGTIGLAADQHQQNGAYGAHQLRVRLPGDPKVYRVILAPADAPISIGGVSADQHFAEPIE